MEGRDKFWRDRALKNSVVVIINNASYSVPCQAFTRALN